MLKINDAVLRRLCEVYAYKVPEAGMLFFGLRGCLPADPFNHNVRKEQAVNAAAIDYLFPRCTLGQWLPEEETVAVFPGSTVPHSKNLRTALAKGGAGANQLMPGFYKDYRKGVHKAGSATGHDAFRQTAPHPIRRSADDLDIDNDDRVEYDNPNDNIHAAWCQGIDHGSFASAGCQVVVGYPSCASRGNSPAVGAWKTFKDNAYALEQEVFPYLLFNGRTAEAIAAAKGKVPLRLTYGSDGPMVDTLQQALRERGYYEGEIDEDFGPRTLRAVIALQKHAFGPNDADGIVGSNTAGALGMEWVQV